MAMSEQELINEKQIEITQELKAEYTQWKLTREIKSLLERQYGQVAQHEIYAALERYLMTLANLPRRGGDPAWASIYRSQAPEADRKFAEELDEHNASRGQKVIADIRGLIAKAFAGQGVWDPSVIRNELTVHPIECSIERARIGLYHEEAKDQPLDRLIRTGGQVATLTVLLRYAALGAYGSSWGIPFKAAHTLYEQFGVRYEGFASPLNSRLMGLEDARFCSLFEDTDGPFGSLGSYFGSGGLAGKGTGKVWIVSPPYTEKILSDAASVVLNRAKEEPDYAAYFMCPRWTDSEAYQKLQSSPYLISKIESTRRGQFMSEDSLGCQTTGAATTFFAIAGSPRAPEIKKKMREGLEMILKNGVPR